MPPQSPTAPPSRRREDDGSRLDACIYQTIMALDMKENGQVGCAYYVVVDSALYLQEDIVTAGMEVVETLLFHVRPTVVITSNRVPEKLVEYLESNSSNDRARGLQEGYYVDITGPSEFNYDAGKEKLLGLEPEIFGHQSTVLTSVAEDHMDVDVDGRGASKQSNIMRLGTHINLDSTLSIGCAGAVLNEIQRRKANAFLSISGQVVDTAFAFQVTSISMFTLADSMFVNADTLAALQIMTSESHPSQMQRSGEKESLSVYGLFKSLAHTPQGKEKLRQMFLRPSIDIDLLQERHRTIATLLRPDNAQVLSEVVLLLRQVKNVKTSLFHLHMGVDMPKGAKTMKKSVWMALAQFALVSIELREAVRAISGGENLAIISKLVNGVDAHDIVTVGEMIHSVIDFDQSVESNRTTIKRGVNAELDELKHGYDGLDDFLVQVTARLKQRVPEWAHEHVRNCIFYPQLGFLTVVTWNPKNGKGMYRGEGLTGDYWEPMFTHQGTILFRNDMMRDLNKEVGDVYNMILDKEIEIIHELNVKVLEHKDSMITASTLFGELDSLVALALGAEKYNWTAPRMTKSNLIQIRAGRHPLQELVVPSFIANDFEIYGGHGSQPEEDNMSEMGGEIPSGPSMLVMTGPNHSGKSVYLKQAALIVYMAHVGSYVPAEQATIGLTDKILTRIATRESVSRNESAFSIDLSQAAFSMNFATRRSLVLIDEFGKGTNANNGAGLMTALLDHFLSLGDERPKVVAATHFHEIFENGFLEGDDNLAFAHMDVRVDLHTPDPEAQVTYLFQLAPGRSISSFGTVCAAMNGVDGAVVARAEAMALLLARGEDLQSACAKLSGAEERKLEEAEAVARRFVEMDIPLPTAGLGEALAAADVEDVRKRLGDLVLGQRKAN